MTNKMAREVICPITGVKHLIVHNDDKENIRALRKWATSLYVRMLQQHKIILSLDCEGWKLGSIKNSLGLLQICEILDESILNYDYCPLQFTSVGVKPGFLIHFPTTPAITDILSGVFSHNNVIICTFDFTSDIASLQERGVIINLDCLFDAQLTNRCPDPITNTQPSSILKSAENLAGSIDEASKAYSFMSQKKGSMFEFLTFLHKDNPDPFLSMIDDDFYEYAAADLVMTGLAVLNCYTHNQKKVAEQMTRTKVQYFMKYQKETGNILGPSALRQAAFIQKRNLADLQELQQKLDKDPSSISINDHSIKHYLTLYVKADNIYNIQNSLLDKNMFSSINAERILDFLGKALEKKRDKISKLNPLDSGFANNYDIYK